MIYESFVIINNNYQQKLENRYSSHRWWRSITIYNSTIPIVTEATGSESSQRHWKTVVYQLFLQIDHTWPNKWAFLDDIILEVWHIKRSRDQTREHDKKELTEISCFELNFFNKKKRGRYFHIYNNFGLWLEGNLDSCQYKVIYNMFGTCQNKYSACQRSLQPVVYLVKTART